MVLFFSVCMLLLFKRYNCSQSVLIFNSRLHGRYHELAPHLVPMDYTNDPDCKLPLALIVNMPELKVNKRNLSLNHLKHDASPVMSLVKSFLMDQPLFFFYPLLGFWVSVYQRCVFLFWIVFSEHS